MKTRLLIILGSIIAVTFGILLAYSVTSNNFDNETWGEKRTLIMNSHGLHNLNPTERDEFITKYTDMLNGEFHDHAYITDLQNEYAVGEPITFTVATWGYGHPCQSPSFVYYYETKDPANVVFEDKFIRLCQVLEESDYTNYYQELGSNRTDQALNQNIYPVFYKSGEYIVSVDDRIEYSFSIIESKSQDDTKNCPDGQTYNEVLFKCVIFSEPDLELSVSEKINFGESFTIHAWLPTYENQNDAQYMISVLDPEGNQVDSTIWFAKDDFVYRFDTTHPAYNITQSVTYSIQVEKTEELQRTGIIYKSLQLDAIYPIQENQNEK